MPDSRSPSDRARAPDAQEEEALRRLADAVLYEGYLLWPYRRSALKNHQRWTFGGVFPRTWSRDHPDDAWWLRSECLLEARPGAAVTAELRFLHAVDRRVARLGPEGPEWVDTLDADGRRILAWQEATERSFRTPPLRLAAEGARWRTSVVLWPDEQTEMVCGPRGPEGAILRRFEGLEGSLTVRTERIGPELFRLSATVRNTTPAPRPARAARPVAQRRAFLSTHLVLRACGARFVSATDPPPALQEAAERCRNVGLWPVLVGEPGARHTMLAAPIILPDHPRIAPESPGDHFDCTEIDQLLVLSLLALSDEERREMAASDPRARVILERTAALTPEELRRLHGAIREMRPLARAAEEGA